MNWQVYMVLCDDDSLYTGISTDPWRRFAEHASGRGAKYFRGRQPLMLVYLESGHNRSSATRREAEIKRLSRSAKQLLIGAEQADGSCRLAETIETYDKRDTDPSIPAPHLPPSPSVVQLSGRKLQPRQ